MDNISLCKLIREALCDPEQAEVLGLSIDQISEIKQYIGEGWLPYYDQALPVTSRDIQRNINRFPQLYRLNLKTTDCHNPAEAAEVRKYFIKWAVMILKRDCQDIKRSRPPRNYSMEEPIGSGERSLTRADIIPDLRLSGIEALIVDELKCIGRQMREYIQKDPDSQLRTCHVRDRPDVNCQILLQLRFLSEPRLTLDDIAKRLQSPLQTIKSRLERSCLPLIKHIALELGYE